MRQPSFELAVAMLLLAGAWGCEDRTTPATSALPSPSPADVVETPPPDAAPVPADPPESTPPAEPAAGPAPGPAGEPAPGIVSNEDTYFVVWGTQPDPIPLNEVFGLDVRVYDGGDRTRLRDDVTLQVDGRMPHHRHGMNREPGVTRRDDGSFLVSGMLFHMPGFWELHFDITEGGITERAQAEVTLE